MSAALVRLAGAGLRLALPILLVLTVYKLMSLPPLLPSAPDLAPVVVPLPHISGEVWDSRGRVVHQEPYVDVPMGDADSVLGKAWRAVYLSASGIDGGLREVSGAFFVPSGPAPKTGWPVISLAHGTTGIGNNCGPSRQPDLMGYAGMVESFLADKYAVALTDYEGLGESGLHPYLEPRTEAFNTIDAVRAMREITPAVSARWVAVGHSQGGQAVWAADELNSYYGNGLQLLGSVALAPSVNSTGAADLVSSGSLTDEQRASFPLALIGGARFNPNLDADAFLHGAADYFREHLSFCKPKGPSTGGKAETPIPVPWQTVVSRLRDANDVKPSNPEAVTALKDALRRVALPQRPLDKPMLVINGEDDAVVLSDWVRFAVSGSCALGGQIEHMQLPNTSHIDVVTTSSEITQRWIADRFAGMPAPSNCPEGSSGSNPNGPS
jgi:pimeloyl-ACP methyl ester carboxylesterase